MALRITLVYAVGTVGGNPVMVLTNALPDSTVGVAYTATLAAVGAGQGSITWSIQSGSLPAGLTLGSSSGIISGTPSGPSGPTSFTILARNTSGLTGTQLLGLNVLPGGGGSSILFPTIGWTQMTNTRLAPVVPAYAEVQGATGPSAVFSTWTAGLFDRGSYNRSADRFLHMGGGHGDWFGNEVYKLDISATPTSSLLKDATHSPSFSTGNESQLIATPTARHHYNGFLHYFQTDKYFMRGAFLSAGGGGTSRVWTLDPNILTLNGNDPTGWTLLTTTGANPTGNSIPLFAYDNGTETIAPGVYSTDQLVGPSPWYKFQAVNGASVNTWSTLSGSIGQFCNGATNMRTDIDPIHRAYYCVGSGHFSKILLDAPFTASDVVGTGCSALKSAQAPGFTWYAPERVFVGYAGGNTVYTYDPVADSCTPQTFTGGPATFQGANGTWGNFQYNPVDGFFISCNSTNEDCFALRLHTNTQLQNDDWNFRRNQAGIIAVQGFDLASDFNVTAGNTTGMKTSPANGSQMTRDTTTYTSGGSSASCFVPAQTGPNACGEYWQVLPSEILPPADVYIQYRYKVDANVLAQNPTSTTFKMDIFASTFDGTCAQKEITLVNDNNRGWPRWYSACGAGAGSQIPLSGAFSGDFLQESGDNCLAAYAPTGGTNTNGVAVGTTTCNAQVNTGFNCHFQGGNNGPNSCATFQPNVWTTYYMWIHLGAFGTTTSSVRMWRALPGQPYQIWSSVDQYTIFQDPGSSHGFNLVDLLNYYTNRNSSVAFGQSGFVHYDELLVSSTPIPVPMAPVT